MSDQPTPQNNRPRRELRNNQPRQGYQQPPERGQQGYPPQQPPVNNQEGYYQQPQQPPVNNQEGYYQQRAQQTPQGRPMPPRPPRPQYNQPLPSQAQQPPVQAPPPQAEKIYIERKSNPLVTVFKVITYPFVKVIQFIMRIITIVLEELVRSVVSFALGILMLIAVIVLVIGYAYALVQVNFNFVQAVPEMLRIFGQFLGLGA